MRGDNDACTENLSKAYEATSGAKHIGNRWLKLLDLCSPHSRNRIASVTRVDTSENISDHFTKIQSRVLFRSHRDIIMGLQRKDTFLARIEDSPPHSQSNAVQFAGQTVEGKTNEGSEPAAKHVRQRGELGGQGGPRIPDDSVSAEETVTATHRVRFGNSITRVSTTDDSSKE